MVQGSALLDAVCGHTESSHNPKAIAGMPCLYVALLCKTFRPGSTSRQSCDFSCLGGAGRSPGAPVGKILSPA